MKNNKIKKLDNIEPDLVSADAEKTNPSIDIGNNNNYYINNTDNSVHPSIRKTKTTKLPKKDKNNKRIKSPHRAKKNKKNGKKVKFIEKVDIVKVECWKKYNLEQTADECELVDDFLDEIDSSKSNNKGNNNNVKDNKDDKNNNKNDNKKKEKTRNKNNNNKLCKGKKGNYTCVCIII